MSQEHKKRWITAVIGLIFVILVYGFLRHWGLAALMIAISTVSYSEFLKFSGASKTLRWPATAVGLGLSTWLCLELPGALEATYFAALLILLRGLWQVHKGRPDDLPGFFREAQSRIFGLVYLVVFPAFVPRVHSLPHGPLLMLLLICIVWMGDIAAYYGGKTLGRHKLSPNVSPGKTLEGSAVGLVACAILAYVFRLYALDHLAPWKLMVIAMLSSVVAQAGDLLESMMKRAYGVKDSGTFFPGHGGVFDRFDSLILVAPFYYILLYLGT